MRIAVEIAERMVLAVRRNPVEHGSLSGKTADQSQSPFDWCRRLEASMRKVTMETETDSHAAAKPMQEDGNAKRRPAEKPWCRQRADVKR